MKAMKINLPDIQSPAGQRGLSLVELMVAMVIGLFVVASVVILFVNTKRTYLVQDANARVQESTRFAYDYMGRQIRMAGYANMQFDISSQLSTNLYAAPKIFGFSGTPLAGTESSSLDTITVSYDTTTDCLGQTVTPPAVNQYRINNTTKQLECLGNGNNTAGVILDDVEAMAVTYGQPGSSSGNITYRDADNTTMATVTTVRMCLLIRALADSDKRGTEPSQIYIDCNGTSQTGTDGYLRRAVNMTFDIRNRLP